MGDFGRCSATGKTDRATECEAPNFLSSKEQLVESLRTLLRIADWLKAKEIDGKQDRSKPENKMWLDKFT